MGKRNTPEDFARTISPEARAFRGSVRRYAVRFTEGTHWQMTGHKLDGDTETKGLEVFSGVGFYSRPKAKAKAEAIAARIGDAQHMVVVATRDEALRRLYKAELEGDPDLAAMFNTATIAIIKPDGTVEIRNRLGVAEPTVKGQTYRAAEDTLLAAMNTLAASLSAAIAALSTAAPTFTGGGPAIAAWAAAVTAVAAAAGNLTAAIAAFNGGASTYLTTVLKAQ